jgi:AAA domain, putative AbiEii toxin, Type IV TA system
MLKHFRAEGTEAGLDLDIEVDPDKRVYCFFGRNGAGKTVLLETLGRTLLLAHTMFSPPPENSVKEGAKTDTELRFRGLSRSAGISERLGPLHVWMPLAAHIDDAMIKTADDKWEITTIRLWAEKEHVRVASHAISGSKSSPPRAFVDRPIVAIGAHNRGFAENLSSPRVRLLGSKADRFVDAFLRTYGVVTRHSVETESLAEWLTARLAMNPAFTRFDDRSFEVDAMLRLLKELDPETFHDVATGAPIQYADGKLWLGGTPFEKLPSGVVSVMKLFQEILGGYGGWTAFLDETDLAQVDGIVLIDEIDAHVHPTWQAKILPLLRRFFPRTTFFVCTHSPLVVATTEEGEAYELMRDDRRVTARRLGNPRDWYLADLCEVAFHVTPPRDDGADVPGMLLDFSVEVKDYLGTKDPARRAKAETLYERIIPSIPPTDPRRSSLDTLRGMLR